MRGLSTERADCFTPIVTGRVSLQRLPRPSSSYYRLSVQPCRAGSGLCGRMCLRASYAAVPAFVAAIAGCRVPPRRPAALPALSAAAALERRVWPGRRCPPTPDGWPTPDTAHGTAATLTLRHTHTGKSQGRRGWSHGRPMRPPALVNRALRRPEWWDDISEEGHKFRSVARSICRIPGTGEVSL